MKLVFLDILPLYLQERRRDHRRQEDRTDLAHPGRKEQEKLGKNDYSKLNRKQKIKSCGKFVPNCLSTRRGIFVLFACWDRVPMILLSWL